MGQACRTCWIAHSDAETRAACDAEQRHATHHRRSPRSGTMGYTQTLFDSRRDQRQGSNQAEDVHPDRAPPSQDTSGKSPAAVAASRNSSAAYARRATAHRNHLWRRSDARWLCGRLRTVLGHAERHAVLSNHKLRRREKRCERCVSCHRRGHSASGGASAAAYQLVL